jgi:hypothetical protein
MITALPAAIQAKLTQTLNPRYLVMPNDQLTKSEGLNNRPGDARRPSLHFRP